MTAPAAHVVTINRATFASRTGRTKPAYRWECSCGEASSWQALRWWVVEKGEEHARPGEPAGQQPDDRVE